MNDSPPPPTPIQYVINIFQAQDWIPAFEHGRALNMADFFLLG